jgi:ABC-type transport system substrate-binding protein
VRRSVLALAAILLATACAAPTSSSDEPADGAPTTLRVAMPNPAWQGFDPQASYTYEQWEVLSCCLQRTLMMYPGLPDAAGTEPIPDLASAPPTISPDGLTWTFHLREGVHYAPPLQDVEVTSGDFVRALLRAGSPDAAGGPGYYLDLIEGYGAYAKGNAGSIVGVQAPDPHTLVVTETHPDGSLGYIFAMPMLAPIPPTPGDAGAPLGVATGHPYADGDGAGYGPFQIATGPYMWEGADHLAVGSPGERTPPGLPGTWRQQRPTIATLVRNPSWDPASDPDRPASPDRIEISIQAPTDPYSMLDDGAVDTVMGADPPPDVVRRYASSSELRSRTARITGAWSQVLTYNVAQPPFDDVHVRRAVTRALDLATIGRAIRFADQGTFFTHVVPDPWEGSLLSSWDPFASASGGNRTAAGRELDASRYGHDGRCTAPSCAHVLVGIEEHGRAGGRDAAAVAASMRHSLAGLGIHATFSTDVNCVDPRNHVAICVGGAWAPDFPSTANWFQPFLGAGIGTLDPTLLGATSHQLAAWGYPTREVPSIDDEYQRCVARQSVDATLCWARLDQSMTTTIVAIVPLFTNDVVRLDGPNVTAFSMDQAWGEPALDRIQVAPT